MNKDEILVPILTAINDLREEVRENRRAILKNSEKIDENSKKIDENSRKIEENSQMIAGNSKNILSLAKRIEKLEERMAEHEKDSKKDRTAILDILCTYENVTDQQYKENKKRIAKLEKQFAALRA